MDRRRDRSRGAGLQLLAGAVQMRRVTIAICWLWLKFASWAAMLILGCLGMILGWEPVWLYVVFVAVAAISSWIEDYRRKELQNEEKGQTAS